MDLYLTAFRYIRGYMLYYYVKYESSKLLRTCILILWSNFCIYSIFGFCVLKYFTNYVQIVCLQATLKARIGRKTVETMVSTSEMGVTQGKVLMLEDLVGS